MEKGILYVVATPIGNLEDTTLRAIRVLGEVDLIACEDTRVTRKLLNHFDIKTPTTSYFQHSKPAKIKQLIDELENGKNVAIVTDAGTPGISDPGNLLVAEAVKNNIEIVSIPGASALTALASISGINMQKFIFMAFPPHKKGRETFFKEVVSIKYPVVYYDSPHRFLKNIELLKKINDKKKIIIGRELTKMFEEIVRGNTDEVLGYFAKNEDKQRGELAIIVY